MLQRWFLLIAFGLFFSCAALPDIIDVTVNGSISGSGNVLGQCINPAPECTFPIGENSFAEFFPFSFSAINTHLGDFETSGGATAIGSNIGEGYGGSVDVTAFQSAMATADALEVSVSGFYSYSARGYSVSLNDTIAVTFDLTQESEALFTAASRDLSPHNNDLLDEVLDSRGNVVLVIPPFGPSLSTVLQPGTYRLDESVAVSASGSLFSGTQLFGTGVNATFTPIVPEPRWAIVAGLFVALCAGRGISRRRRSGAILANNTPW